MPENRYDHTLSWNLNKIETKFERSLNKIWIEFEPNYRLPKSWEPLRPKWPVFPSVCLKLTIVTKFLESEISFYFVGESHAVFDSFLGKHFLKQLLTSWWPLLYKNSIPKKYMLTLVSHCILVVGGGALIFRTLPCQKRINKELHEFFIQSGQLSW